MELRRICCEETDRARQLRIDELSTQQERNPRTVSQLLTQIQDLQNNVNSVADAREFYDPETASSSGATHVPSQPCTIPSPRTMPCRDSGLRMIDGMLWVLQETFLKAYLLEKDHPQLRKFTEFGIIFLRIGNIYCRKDNGTCKRSETRAAEFVNTPTPRFHQGIATQNPSSHTGRTYSHSGMMDCPRFPISEMHLGRFPDSLEF